MSRAIALTSDVESKTTQRSNVHLPRPVRPGKQWRFESFERNQARDKISFNVVGQRGLAYARQCHGSPLQQIRKAALSRRQQPAAKQLEISSTFVQEKQTVFDCSSYYARHVILLPHMIDTLCEDLIRILI